MTPANSSEANLVLAAEDFDRDEFKRLHRFSSNDERVIAKLVAHGPVLLQGSRGSGKSALMREAADRLPLSDEKAPALGVYLSLRHMPLLRSAGDVYQRILCELLIDRISRLLASSKYAFDASPSLSSVQAGLTDLAQGTQKRVVLMFDDAAHIGREASLADFFDVFRTLSSSAVSCKATIYPGVTNFGNRFDVYNDATVVDVIRDEDQPGFRKLFSEVVQARFPELAEKRFTSDLPVEDFAGFVGKSVLGNMRSFIFACNYVTVIEEDRNVGLPTLSRCFLEMTRNFYWPLIDEVKPKLGKYVPVVDLSKQIAETLLAECGRQQSSSVIVHRDIVTRLAKAFEILEYVGFISRRESSRAMKSGGRGSRYALNLCMLLENVSGTRLTNDLYQKWKASPDEPVQIHSKGVALANLTMPDLDEGRDPEILNDPLGTIQKSSAYPYGLSERMIEKLHEAEINTIRDLYEAPEDKLDDIPYIGDYRVKQLKNIVAQAIWL
jgi:hypothetical protein